MIGGRHSKSFWGCEAISRFYPRVIINRLVKKIKCTPVWIFIMTAASSSPSLALPAPSYAVVELDRMARWDVYLRLQELSVSCKCKLGVPLQVQVNSVTEAIQLWCVVQACTADKLSHLAHLERCWQLKCPQ